LSAELNLIYVAECKDFTDIVNLKIQKTLLLYMEILANISYKTTEFRFTCPKEEYKQHENIQITKGDTCSLN